MCIVLKIRCLGGRTLSFCSSVSGYRKKVYITDVEFSRP